MAAAALAARNRHAAVDAGYGTARKEACKQQQDFWKNVVSFLWALNFLLQSLIKYFPGRTKSF
jgi:hypothetical protein